MNLSHFKLKDFLKLSGPQLDEIYEQAGTPELEELEGDYDGLLLEGHVPGLKARFPITPVNQPWLPWKGKAFFSASARGGKGKNRFEAGPVKRGIWNFETTLTPSQFGGKDACLVNYDIPGNAAWMRKGVFDEMKKIRENLYLGKGGIKVGKANAFTFYWAIGKNGTTV